MRDGPQVVGRQAAHLRGRRVDDQHLARRGVDQPLRRRREPRRRGAPTRHTVVIKTSVPDPKLPTMDVYILPKHIWGKIEPGRARQVRRPGRRRLRPLRAREVREGPVRPLQGQPELLGGQAGRRQGRAAQVQQPGRDGRRAEDRRARRRRGHPGHRVQPARRRTTNIETVEGYQGAMSEIAINGGDGLKKPHPALLDPKVRTGDRRTRSTRRRSSTACWPGSASRPRR